MSYLALYRKYRPIKFNDIYGQEEIVTVLKNAIMRNKVSHAYLFSGPRGTGKTTIAKIIARLVNCENPIDGDACGKCYSCLNFLNSGDIVEIDAASNNGVDEIRELRDKINLVPTSSKYKVYIIDEVHMLTNQAFNALLKTLEEPPSHVIFILATTEPHKIPLTIASRCQKFRFSKISDDKIVDRLKEISKNENISISDDALFEIARISDGGMRDAINMLDQLVAFTNSKITLEDIYAVNGTVSYSNLFDLLKNIKDNDKIKIIEFIDHFDIDGKEINRFVSELIIFVKDIILYKNTGKLSEVVDKNEAIKKIDEIFSDNELYIFIEMLNETQNKMKNSTHSSIILMTSLLKFSDNNYHFVENKNQENIISEEKNIVESSVKKDVNNISQSNNLSDKEYEIRINNALALASKDELNSIRNKWKLIDGYIFEEEYSTISGLLKDSIIVVGSNKYLIIVNDLDSIVQRINNNYTIMDKLLTKILGHNVFSVCMTKNDWNIKKNEYINNLKNGVKYNVIEEKKTKLKKNDMSPVDELINLVGDNMIEYK